MNFSYRMFIIYYYFLSILIYKYSMLVSKALNNYIHLSPRVGHIIGIHTDFNKFFSCKHTFNLANTVPNYAVTAVILLCLPE